MANPREQRLYPCPVCKTPLTRAAFEKALKIHDEKEKYNKAVLKKLEARAQNFDQEVNRAEQRGRNAEQRRGQRLMAGAQKQIKSLKDRIAHLE